MRVDFPELVTPTTGIETLSGMVLVARRLFNAIVLLDKVKWRNESGTDQSFPCARLQFKFSSNQSLQQPM